MRKIGNCRIRFDAVKKCSRISGRGGPERKDANTRPVIDLDDP